MALHTNQLKGGNRSRFFHPTAVHDHFSQMNDNRAANVQRLAAIVSVRVQAMLANHPFYRTLVRA